MLEGGKPTPLTANQVSPQRLVALTFAFGPMAAGWLVGTHRRSLHLTGAVDFELPAKKALPLWFLVAMECLKRRRKWRVEVHPKLRGGSSYRVFWREKGRYVF